jgi:hypothetical protein
MINHWLPNSLHSVLLAAGKHSFENLVIGDPADFDVLQNQAGRPPWVDCCGCRQALASLRVRFGYTQMAVSMPQLGFNILDVHDIRMYQDVSGCITRLVTMDVPGPLCSRLL